LRLTVKMQEAPERVLRSNGTRSSFGTKQQVCGAKEAIFEDESQIRYRPGLDQLLKAKEGAQKTKANWETL